MFRFEHPHFLWLLAIIPVMTVIYFINKIWKMKSREKFAGHDLVNYIIPGISKRKPGLKFFLYSAAMVSVIIALANPQMGTKMEEVKREGVDLIIALDVSNSMKAEDIKPNRLERAKMAIEKLLEYLKSDRIGLVVFAGEAYVQLPITSDYAAARLYTRAIGTDIVPTQGTAIGAAIERCVKSLESDDSKNRAIIIISDGENHEDNALEAAQAASAKGITIHTIGMGSPQGAPIPEYRGNAKAGYRSDKEGNTVVSKLNEEMLQEVASAGGGIYVRATTSSAGLNSLFNEINKMKKSEYEARQYTDYEDRFQPFIIIALLLLTIEFLIPDKKSKWADKLKLFNA